MGTNKQNTALSRVEEFERALFETETHEADVQRVAELSFGGIPEVGGLRALCWKLMLGVLPPDRRAWAAAQAEARRSYAAVVRGIAQSEEDERATRQLVWQIRADVQRTLPDIALFRSRVDNGEDGSRSSTLGSCHATAQPRADALSEARRALGERIAAAQESKDDEGCGGGHGSGTWLEEPAQTHAEVVERILFVYARFNRGVGYVQGMNEVVGPLYYVLAAGSGGSGEVEAETFHALVLALRGAHLDLFTAALDGGGLRHVLRQWWDTQVAAADVALWRRLHAIGLRPEDFAVRWLLVWGARELALPDVLELWDALLANRVQLAAPAEERGAALAQALQGTAVRADAGRLRCEVRVARDACGDGGDTAQLGLLLDFFTALVLALRTQLLRLPLDECLALLQHLPRDSPALAVRSLLDAMQRLRAQRAASRAVHACRAVLACARRRAGPNVASLAPLFAPADELPCDAPVGGTKVVRLLGRLGLRTPPISPPALPAPVDCLLVALLQAAAAAATAEIGGGNVAARMDVFEVVAWDDRARVATMRRLGECGAQHPSLANARAASAEEPDVVASLAPMPKPNVVASPAPRQRMSSSASSAATATEDGSSGGWWVRRAPRLVELCDSDSDCGL
ncbi:hypothetical protein H4R24_002663 [Coemansia sp. RSA 988]|nr:hypothetical protein H4R24_002663 [Coemansia sp. RSA 988]